MTVPSNFRYKGRIPDDPLHSLEDHLTPEGLHKPPTGMPAMPACVAIPGLGCVFQYGATVKGSKVAYDPANDCHGNFMSAKLQVHNNCYNYAIDMATNSFAHPGRRHGLPDVIDECGNVNTDLVLDGAQRDGLKLIPNVTSLYDLRKRSADFGPGHAIALLIAPAIPAAKFVGDFHFVRADRLGDDPPSWSQKDGRDQITNFDFAGAPISDPSRANWTVNAGPKKPGQPDFVVTYAFITYMFVPAMGVAII
jgi:hypothetical protein